MADNRFEGLDDLLKQPLPAEAQPEARNRFEGLDDLLQPAPPKGPNRFLDPNASPEPESQQGNPLDAMQDPAPSPVNPGDRSLMGAFSGGVSRGWKQTLAAVPQLKGIYAEYQGDLPGAEQAFQEAKAIEAEAPPPMQEFKDISSFEDAGIWLAEGLGSQLPVLGSMVVSGGLGGAITNLTARGLLSSAGARALATKVGGTAAASTAVTGLETAGIGGELKEATGSYHPEVAALGGTAAGLLEMVVPMSLARGLFGGRELGKTIITTGLKAAGMEAATEAGQESVALLAREYADPNFELFSPESGWRIAESAVLGGVIGGGLGAAAHPFSGEKRGSQINIDPGTSEGWGLRPVKWLKDKYEAYGDPRKKDLKLAMRANPELDAFEAGILLDTVGIDWATAGARMAQVDQIGEFIEANTKRYAHPLNSGEIVNSTDLEEVLAMFPPETNPTEGLVEVNQGELSPIGITASIQDLPISETDPRIFFLPGTKPEEKFQALEKFKEIAQYADPAIQEVSYNTALNLGLRVIPSYGASFKYTGQVKGKAVDKVPPSGRTWKTQPLKAFGEPVAIDLNKIKPGEMSGYDASLLTKDNWKQHVNFPTEMNSTERAKIEKDLEYKFSVGLGLFEDDIIDLMRKGVWITPTVQANYLAFAKGVNIKGKSTRGINKGDPYDAIRNSSLKDQNKDGVIKLINKVDKSSPEYEVVKKALPILAGILKRLNVPLLQSVEMVPGTTFYGQYHPVQHRIEIAVFPPGQFPNASTLHTLIHEVGHHVTMWSFQKLPVDMQQQVFAAWRRHVLAWHKDKAHGTRFLSNENPMAPEIHGHTTYALSFIEWLTEQFVRWSVRKTPGFSEYNKTIGQLKDKLEEFFDAVESIPAMKGNSYPDHYMSEWMEWLKNEGKDAKAMRRLASGLFMPETHPMGRRVTEILEQVIEQNKHLFPNGWKIMVGEPGAGNTAVTINATKSVIIGLSALEMGAKGTISHEAVHAVRDLFTPQEWQVLTNAVPPEVKALVKKEWTAFYSQQAERLFPGDAMAQMNYLRKMREEEGVAIIIGMRASGVSIEPQADTLLDKLIQFMTRIAELLKTQLGWTTKESVLSDFFNGEIAKRDQQSAVFSQHVKWLQEMNENMKTLEEPLPPDRTNLFPRVPRPPVEVSAPANDVKSPEGVQITDLGLQSPANQPQTADMNYEEMPTQIVKVGPDLWVKVFRQSVGGEAVAVQYRFYTDVTPERFKTLQDKNRYLSLEGTEVGAVLMSHNPKGFEVDYVTVRKQFRRATSQGRNEGFATSFYRFIEKDLNQAMKPSGLLLENGYQMWKNRDPHAVRYHVYDQDANEYLSPNYIQNKISLMEKIKNPGEDVKKEIAFFKALRNKVDPKAWTDPELEKMFQIASKQRLYETGMVMQRQHRTAAESTLTGERGVPVGFEEALASSMRESQALNEKQLQLEAGMGAAMQPELRPMRHLLGFPQLTPAQKKKLKGVTNEADRIGWFSKYWWGIHQLAWVNPHIAELRSYMGVIENWAAKVEQWISLADTTARQWDKTLSPQEKNNLAQLFFYMTEMRYLSPQEVAAKVVRLPTQAELARAFQGYKISPAGQAVYTRVESDFAAFLQEMERISIASITREFAGQRVNNQPSQAEIKALAELAAEMKAMRSRPYFPMTRFGEWTMTIRDPNANNRVVAFYTFESQKERNEYISTAASQWAGNDIQVGRLPEEVMEFVGIPGPLLRRIKAQLPGLTPDQRNWIDTLANQMSPERSFRKKWLQRKETPGYSLDAFRVYANYFQTGARYLARLEYKDLAQEQINQLEKTSKELLKDSAKRSQMVSFMNKHLKYMMEGGRDWAKLKSFIAMWHLGYSPMAALMNFTQMPMVTVPYLSSLFGNGPTMRAMFVANTALKASFGGTWTRAPWPGYEKGRQELIAQGKIDAGQAPELAAYASANNLYKTSAGNATARFYRGLAQHSMWMFGKAERMNRELTYAMTFKLAMENPKTKHIQDIANNRMADIAALMGKISVSYDEAVAIIAAREAIDRTHGIYAPWARPAFMRQPLAATILTFFTYMQMMLFSLRNNPGNIKHMFMLLAIAGLMGLPGADDLDRVIEAVARRIFGKDFSPKNEARKFMVEILEGTPYKSYGPDLLLHGISRFGFGMGLLPEGLGAPRFDASGNMSMGKIVPGLGEAATAWGTYQDWSKVMGASTQQAAGAGFGVMFSMLQFLSAAADPTSSEAKRWEKVMPRAVKAMSKATRYMIEQKETMRSGATFHTFDRRDPDDMATIVAQFLGATPMELNQKWQANAEIQEKLMFYRAQKRVLYEQFIHTVEANDLEGRKEVIDAIIRFNSDIRKLGIPSLGIDAARLQSSARNRTRTKVLQEMDLPAARSEMPAVRSMQEMYPEVQWKKVR